jgi:predicted membrane-bound spermidine synthase
MNPRVFAVSLLLFGSGLCALVYQTVWLREFRLIFGASTAATAAVLGIFMGGLGVGSMLLGGRAQKSARPLAFYANLEFGIALTAALTPFLVTLVRHVYSALGGSLTLGPFWGAVARLALSALVLAGPTLLMGGTLPAAARSVIGREDAGRRGLAWLYGINTLGAVTGAMVATFFALEALGNRHTLWTACILNSIVALTARRLARSFPEPDDSPAETAIEQPQSQAPAPLVLTASALVGFAFLLMELVWYRMLSPLLGGSTFTFGLILAVALLGIGLGGTLYALAGQRAGGTLTAFAWTCALEALAIAAPYALGDRLAVLAAHLRSLSTVGFWPQVFGWFIVIAIAVLPAAIIAGFQFPLLVALLGRGGREVGRDTARAYALNTAGAIAGSLAGGFGLLPLFTAPGVWKLVIALLACLSLVALLVQQRRSAGLGFPAFGVTGSVFAAAALLFTLGPTAAWRHSGVGVGRSGLDASSRNALRNHLGQFRQHTIWESEGVESSVAIYAMHGASFVVNGKSDGNIRADAGTQVMGGLIGAALLPKLQTACVIGLGTGSTAGWLAQVPGIERVDAMELEPAILEVARICELANQHVLDNPKCRVLLGDAREMLITTKQRYDLIFSEPSNPYRAGIASLFTSEFYETARARLNSDGLFLQWVQAYEVDGDAIRMVLATLGGVFPHVEVWTTQAGDLLLVASAQPRAWDIATLRKRLQIEPFRTATRRIWGIDSAEGFLAHFCAGAEVARRLATLPGIQVNTDDNTLLEFAFARSVGRSSGFQTPELLRVADDLHATRPNVFGDVDWPRVLEERFAMFTHDGYPPPAAPPGSEEVSARCDIRRMVAEKEVPVAGRLWLQKKPAPLNPGDVETFALALAEAASDDALPFIAQLRETSEAEACAIEAILRARQSRMADAIQPLLAAFAAFRRDPWPEAELQSRAFQLAWKIIETRPEAAPRFFDALKSGPLPGYLMEGARRMTLVHLTIQMWKARQPVSGEGFALLEPWPNWNRDDLTNRYKFYKSTGLGDIERARADLEEFLAAEGGAFNRGLVKPTPADASPETGKDPVIVSEAKNDGEGEPPQAK